ncbi:MAG: hypothetical protein JSR80_04325 [Verrucomicrobia bacterium]|nr:hypothetical protein [Verrucomicrobiota bacterium]
MKNKIALAVAMLGMISGFSLSTPAYGAPATSTVESSSYSKNSDKEQRLIKEEREFSRKLDRQSQRKFRALTAEQREDAMDLADKEGMCPNEAVNEISERSSVGVAKSGRLGKASKEVAPMTDEEREFSRKLDRKEQRMFRSFTEEQREDAMDLSDNQGMNPNQAVRKAAGMKS